MSTRMIASRLALHREPDPEQARQAAKNSYIASGGQIVLINKDWLRNKMDRDLLDTLAQEALGVKGKI